MPTIGLVVGGMRCRRCVREVTARLRDVPGVETVIADSGSSRVRVAGTMTGDDVLRALAGLAYPVQILDEDEVEAALEDSRVSADRPGTATGQPSP